jgi:6-phosphogluconolactonase
MARLDVAAVQIADSTDVPRIGARWIAQQLEQAIAERGAATLALSGGHTPRRVYEELASLSIPWDRVGAPHVHRMPADRADLESAAAEYADELPEALDAMVLGMGEDGHTASLFPGHEWSHSAGRRVIVVRGAPKPPPDRLSVTPEVIWAARARLVLATGASKAPQIVGALEGEANPARYPVHLARGATWLLDRAAASLLFKQR